MGYYAGGQCWDDVQSARLAWCQSMDTGAYAMSCNIVDNGGVRIKLIRSDGTSINVTHNPQLPLCDQQPPMWQQATPVIAAVVFLWASIWAFKKIVGLFEDSGVK